MNGTKVISIADRIAYLIFQSRFSDFGFLFSQFSHDFNVIGCKYTDIAHYDRYKKNVMRISIEQKA